MRGKLRTRLTYADLDEFVEAFAEHGDWEGCTGIYGEPRGGLPIAVALSHAIGLPLLSAQSETMLWVDDIVDKGETIERALLVYPNAKYTAWVVRHYLRWSCMLQPGIILNDDRWIVFPWERDENADADAAKYAASRAGL